MTRIGNTWIGLLFLAAAIHGEFTIHLGQKFMPNAIFVRLDGGKNQTNGGCSQTSISHIFPKSTIGLDWTRTGTHYADSWPVTTTQEPVEITTYNPKDGRICERQRRILTIPEHNRLDDPTIRTIYTCYKCASSDLRQSIRFLSDADDASRLTRQETYANLQLGILNEDRNDAYIQSFHHNRDETILSNLEIDVSLGVDSIVVSEPSIATRLASGQRRLIESSSRLPSFANQEDTDNSSSSGSGSGSGSSTLQNSRWDSSFDEVLLQLENETEFHPSIGVTPFDAKMHTQNDTNPSSLVPTPRMEPRGNGCSLVANECCVNSDCTDSDNICIGRTCIDEGLPRFTLSWVGDDDIDLYVVTPGGFRLSFKDDFDPHTGGRVGEPVEQEMAGYHVENVYFPIDGSAPGGTYQFYVRPLTTVGKEDEWTLAVVDESGEVIQHRGSRFSPIYEYTRPASKPIPTSRPSPRPTPHPPTSKPIPSPTPPSIGRPSLPPEQRTCNPLVDECCADTDCLFAGELCFNRNCIDKGNPRITLSWVGDDDLDLFVLTPAGEELSFMNFFDPLSGGRFGEEIDQFGTGYHVESVYFPMTGAPYGNYQFFTRPLTTVQGKDVWNITVVDQGSMVVSETGVGESPSFVYFRERPIDTPTPPTSQPVAPTPGFPTPTRAPGTAPMRPPQTIPGGPPSRPPQTDPECNPFFDECCESSDCRTSRDVCEQRTCIRDGNPRFSLIWDGDDDLDLYVLTPDGVEISTSDTFDIFSGGRFEMDPATGQSGKHVENVYFPVLGTPVGVFSYGVRATSIIQRSDTWVLEVYDDGELVDSKSGTAASQEFQYRRDETFEGPQRPRPSPPRCSPLSDECCLDMDCEGEASICVQRTCITDGSPRVTLRWVGDDNLNLIVEAPNGAVLSGRSPIDSVTGGRHEQDPDQEEFGFHVESVYFPANRAVAGSYRYSVDSVTTNGVGADVWRISVYEGGAEVDEESGIGGSRDFVYERLEGAPPPTPPSPTSPPFAIVPCSTSTSECCQDSDCSSHEVCANRNCVGDGNPRITLTWTGDDDFDLFVRTPFGNIIFYNNREDSKTKGVFDQKAVQTSYGFHAENVFFPKTGSPLGEYTAGVRLASRRGTPDVWTLRIFDGGEQQLSKTGTSDSDFFTYHRNDIAPVAPVASPSIAPAISPVTERPPPGQSPVTGPRDCPHECCSDTDCVAPGELCVQRTCIMQGTPRFTLTWTGNDDLSLVVTTPRGNTISYLNPSDEESGGVFAQDSDQDEFGFHVENIVFPTRGGPEGQYSYHVKSAASRGDPDRWAIKVYVDEELVAWRTGIGESRTFTYDYGATVILPTASPVQAPFPAVPIATRAPVIPSTDVSCQTDSDCTGDGQICVQERCISDGNLRFTLTWSGNDDLDIFVETPDGDVISKGNPFDAISGGRFGQPGNQTGFDRHVENIFFPLGPSGTYRYYVRSSVAQGSNDFWRLTVSVDGDSQATRSGTGDSEVFLFSFNNDDLDPNMPTAAPVAPECLVSSQCSSDEACVNRLCVEDGNPRVTLTWTGDDDLDLVLETPQGIILSFFNPSDPLSSGQFGSSAGVQTSFDKHIENIFFPENDGPPGTYTISVKSFIQRRSADKWSIEAVVNGQVVVSESSIGESEDLTFIVEDPGQPASFPTPAPTEDSFCSTASNECCSDIDCFGNEACTQRTCIDEGTPRFTLTWTGDDDLDLVVQTPLDTFVSFLQDFDEASGGRFGDGGDQFDFGRHVENVYFPLGESPTGTYSYFVRSFIAVGDDDVWTVRVFENGRTVASTTGSGNSGTLTFEFSGVIPTSPPASGPSPVLPTLAPQIQPTFAPECNVLQEECCTDSQCITEVETCVQNQCIDLGNPRFTLTWTGDDDLDLKVETPVGSVISFVTPLDEPSGGVYGEEGSQFVLDRHVENIYFMDRPSGGAPTGIYKYMVDSFFQRNGNDRWTVAVYVNNQEVASETGFGDSIEFTYEFQGSATGSTARAAPLHPSCDQRVEECCSDANCLADQELCVHQTCITRGNPRFTLTWTGDDDLDLTVVTPFGTTLNIASPADPLSGGVFGGEGDQLSFGQHVENVYFPLTGGPSGTYTFYVGIFDEIGAPDDWMVTVYINDEPVLSKSGVGASNFLLFEFTDGFTLPPAELATARSTTHNNTTDLPNQAALSCNPDTDECCSDADCPAPNTLCVQRVCIDEGNPRFTLTWNGDDNYDLMVTPPIGSIVSFDHPTDYESGGRFGEEGFQASPGLHAENVFFPLRGGPLGTYTIHIQPYQILDDADDWTIGVYVDGREVHSFSGSGDSGSLIYKYSHGTIFPNLEVVGEEIIPPCSLEIAECCVDDDCSGLTNRCLQRTCIPVSVHDTSVVLTWIGDDDLDLKVTTPAGREVSYLNPKDGSTGGEFIQTNSDYERWQPIMARSERVVFPNTTSHTEEIGTYRYQVEGFNIVGSMDKWSTRIFIDGEEVDQQHGKGDSDVFTFTATYLNLESSGASARSISGGSTNIFDSNNSNNNSETVDFTMTYYDHHETNDTSAEVAG